MGQLAWEAGQQVLTETEHRALFHAEHVRKSFLQRSLHLNTFMHKFYFFLECFNIVLVMT